MRTRDHHRMVTETSKATNFQARFFYNTFLYWLTNLLINNNFLYWQVFFRWVKVTKNTTNLEAHFFITVFILINKPITFPCGQFYPWEDFVQTNLFA